MSSTTRLLAHAIPAAALGALGWAAAGPSPELLGLLCLAGVTPWLVTIDLRQHRLPNPLVLAAIGAAIASCVGEWIVAGHAPIVPLLSAVAYAAFLLLLHAVGGMGMGDVKLAGALGLCAWIPSVAVLSPVLAFCVGGVVAIVLLIAGHRGRRIAFGPYLLGGYWGAVGLVVLCGAVA